MPEKFRPASILQANNLSCWLRCRVCPDPQAGRRAPFGAPLAFGK